MNRNASSTYSLQRWLVHTLLVFVYFIVTCLPTHAQLSLSLNTPNVSISQGDILTFTASIHNQGSSVLFLNSDDFVFNFPDLTLDDTWFWVNTPASMQPGEIWSGDLFDITAGVNAVLGNYTGEFTILGGADINTLNVLASEPFSVTVTPATAPEPSSLALFILNGLPVAGGALRRRLIKANYSQQKGKE